GCEPIAAVRLAVGRLELEHAELAPVESLPRGQVREASALFSVAGPLDRAREVEDFLLQVVARRRCRQVDRTLREMDGVGRLEKPPRWMEEDAGGLREGSLAVAPTHVAFQTRLASAVVVVGALGTDGH